jgi:hypothetical protein
MKQNRRFSIEEVDNGWLLKVSEPGSDKLVGRWVFIYLADLFEHLTKELEKGATT